MKLFHYISLPTVAAKKEDSMICVLASIRVKEGEHAAFIEIFKANAQKVRDLYLQEVALTP